MKSDPLPIPAWALDATTAYPCPCGREMDDTFVVTKGEKDLIRLFHPECVQEYLDLGEEDDDD